METYQEMTKRPLITFALICYNQEHFISEAIEGALSQNYTPLEIILSDDCSSDRSFEIMEEMARKYRGKHKIVLNKNVNNLGIGGHINKIMELSNGEIIVGAAGDDISLSERVDKIYNAYKGSEGKAISIFSNHVSIDKYGKEGSIRWNKNFEDDYFSPNMLARKYFILTGCTHAWHKDNIKIFGDIITPLTCEDTVIPFRSSIIGQIKYIPEVLVKARRHDTNIFLHDQERNNIYDIEKEIEKDLKHEKWWAFEKKNICINRIKDVEMAKKLLIKGDEDLENIEKILRNNLIGVEEDILLYNGNYFKRINIMFNNVINTGDLKKFRHRVGVYIIPWLYKKYMGMKYRMAGNA